MRHHKKSRCEMLSRRQRCLTPLPFCHYLLGRVQAICPAERVAVLWVERRTLYAELWPRVQLWPRQLDARRYAGPWPIIAHPPCGPWGKYHHRSHQPRECGILAVELVHRWGGVIEQPVGSRLFREHGRDGLIERVNQGDYGHAALKPTLLYFARRAVY